MATFWICLTWACLIWYSTITVFVAIKGVTDIRTMLRNLAGGRDGDRGGPAAGA